MMTKVSPANPNSLFDKVPTIEATNRPRRRSIIREFCLNTSTHALPGIARSESLHNRAFWSVSFIAFSGIMTYFVVTAIISYFQYQTNIDISYETQSIQQFPAFSLCNLSPTRYETVIGPFLNYTNSNSSAIANDTTTFHQSQLMQLMDFLIYKTNQGELDESYFFTLPSMLHTCTYNNQPCSAQDFISFSSSLYGLCYTFNAKLQNESSDNLHYTNDYGGIGRLTLGLYIHSYQYVPYVQNSAGIIALVHDNTQLPLIESAGITLEPGRKHKLAYKKKLAYFLPSPYTTCASDLPLSMKAMLANYNGADYGYADATCYQLCEQVYVYKQCGCVNPNMWNARRIVEPGATESILVSLCNATNFCYVIASQAFWTSSSLFDQYCSQCTPQCLITTFTVQASASRAPLEWDMSSIKSFVENSSVSLPTNWSSLWREYIKENYVMIEVLRETNVIETNSQVASMGVVDLLSNIGGQTGLWIGISFLSIMEVVEMLYRLIRLEVRLIKSALQRKSQTVP